MKIPTIETERLILRAFQTDDLEPYAEMYADESFAQYIGGTLPTKAQVWERMAIVLGHWYLLGYGIWALEHRETGEFVGRAGLLNFPGWPDVEVCWALGPKFWGNGYATEAGRASIQWAFEEAGIERLISLVHPDNRASAAVAVRLGETLWKRIEFGGKPVDVYEILKIQESQCGS